MTWKAVRLGYLEGALVKGFYLVIPAPELIGLRKIVQRLCDVGVVGAKGLFPYIQGPAEKGKSIAIPALGEVNIRKAVE